MPTFDIRVPIVGVHTGMALAGVMNDNTDDTEQIYGDGTNSSVGEQLQQFVIVRKALDEAAKRRVFGQLADVKAMPKHYGKTIKQMLYIPILDDRNQNDQGLDASGAVIADGNLYGSSKDAGFIQSKIPTLTEHGGRVNRVGMKRIVIQGSMAKFGFYQEYSQEMLDFDTDAQLKQHITTEMVRAATEINEDQIQIDLINGAGVIRYGGEAIDITEVTGNANDVISVPTYEGLSRLETTLDENRTPKEFSIITGSRLIDTATIDAARPMIIGTEVLPTLYRMTDFHGEPAFVPVRRYAAAGKVAHGEVGAIGGFRFIVAPEMMHFAGAGKDDDGSNAGYRTTGGKYDVFPMLVVGKGSFTQIGFQLGKSKKTVKFKITDRPPSDNHLDPYGETGYYSIKWYYGMLIMRPERIATYFTVAEI